MASSLVASPFGAGAHPSGEMSCVLKLDSRGEVTSTAARKLMDGTIYL